ncbi:nucleotide exchange factor GrpE [Halobacteriales archaeon QS_4_69_31]|nr:MAG: nucleotide exchange factor GrpE [Halobacteriales archaeon QS_4_69_31]
MTEQDAADADAGEGSKPDDAVAAETASGDAADNGDQTAAGATGDADSGDAAAAGGDRERDGDSPTLDDELDEELAEADLDGALVERVESADAESVARELAALRARVDALESQLEDREAELDEVASKLKRKQADFQNYKKRMEKRREQERQRATEDLVERLLDVRDNLLRALDQETADADDIREGIETTLTQFDRVLDEENVDVVDPEPGETVDPHTHEVLMRVDSDQPEDAIADVHRPGYVMAEKVLRPAQVTVSEGGGGDSESGGNDSEGGGDEN